jgi:hypothetical protein
MAGSSSTWVGEELPCGECVGRGAGMGGDLGQMQQMGGLGVGVVSPTHLPPSLELVCRVWGASSCWAGVWGGCAAAATRALGAAVPAGGDAQASVAPPRLGLHGEGGQCHGGGGGRPGSNGLSSSLPLGGGLGPHGAQASFNPKRGAGA